MFSSILAMFSQPSKPVLREMIFLHPNSPADLPTTAGEIEIPAQASYWNEVNKKILLKPHESFEKMIKF